MGLGVSIVNEIVKGSGVNLTQTQKEKAVKYLEVEEANECTNVGQLAKLSLSQIQTMFGVKTIFGTVIWEWLQKSVEEDQKEAIEYIDIPSMPADLNSIPKLAVSGNAKLDIPKAMDMLNFVIMYGIGTEDIGKNLTKMISQRLAEKEEIATEDIISTFAIAAKFNDVDASLAASLEFNLSLVANRHAVAHEVIEGTKRAVVEYIGIALGIREDLSDFNSILLRRSFLAKGTPKEVGADDLYVGAEEFVQSLNSNLKGFNYPTIKATLDLYNDLFKRLDSAALHKFLGVTDRGDLLSRLGIKYTPKEIAGLNRLPELLYQILYTMENKKILEDSRVLCNYLENIWKSRKLVNWAGFGEIKATVVLDVLHGAQTTAISRAELPDILEEYLEFQNVKACPACNSVRGLPDDSKNDGQGELCPNCGHDYTQQV